MDFVAKAVPPDLSGARMNIVVVAIGLLVAIAVLAVLPAICAWQRRGPHVDTVPTAAVLWGIVAALSSVYDLLALSRWQSEYRVRLMSGYLDSADTSGAPPLHAKLYAGLAAWYFIMLLLSLRRGANAVFPPTNDEPPPAH